MVKSRFIIAFLLLVGYTQATTLTVCPSGCDYSSIQAAINAADNDYVIEVQSGIYPEEVVIYKDILLRCIDTGNGNPVTGVVYLGNHSDSVLDGIGCLALFPGFPSPNIILRNISINGIPINTTNKNYGDVAVIGYILDDVTKFNGDPCYTLETQTINGPVTNGEYLNLSFYISGAGSVDNCRLRISISPSIIKGKTFTCTYPDNDSKNNRMSTGDIKLKKEIKNGSILDMDISHIFIKSKNSTRANIGSIGVPNQGVFYPPFNIGFEIADDAPPGDHNVYINLLYKNNDQWLMEKQIIPIHVRYWYESERLQILVYLALILGALASLTRLIEFLGLKKILKEFISDP